MTERLEFLKEKVTDLYECNGLWGWVVEWQCSACQDYYVTHSVDELIDLPPCGYCEGHFDKMEVRGTR